MVTILIFGFLFFNMAIQHWIFLIEHEDVADYLSANENKVYEKELLIANENKVY